MTSRVLIPIGLSALLLTACGGSSKNDGSGGSASGGGAQGGSNPQGSGGSSDTGGMGGDASGGSTASGGGGAAPAGSGGSNGSGGSASACSGDKPDATNTGVPAGVSLTTVNGDVTVTQDGMTIDAQDIHGFLTIKASHVTVKRSIVRGDATSATTAIIRIDSGTDILIEDTEVAAAHPSVDLDGVWGSNFTARRLNIHGGVDGMKVEDNSIVECSYIHDLASFASDPNQGGGATHNDTIQILDGVTIHIRQNQLVASNKQNSAIQVTQDFGKVSDLHIENNWADGGGCTFNIASKGKPTLTDVHVIDNRFGRNQGFEGCAILRSLETTLDASGNVFDNDNSPVVIQAHD